MGGFSMRLMVLYEIVGNCVVTVAATTVITA